MHDCIESLAFARDQLVMRDEVVHAWLVEQGGSWLASCDGRALPPPEELRQWADELAAVGNLAYGMADLEHLARVAAGENDGWGAGHLPHPAMRSTTGGAGVGGQP